ncbi:MAG: hypothetical protein FWC58_04115 [Desulfobulbus sp.]|nr:hypothetical protein [Desulfobulbus sp.]
MKPPRTSWGDFPDVQIHAPESAVKQHPAYREAKAGDAIAARLLVNATINPVEVEKLAALFAGDRPFLVSAHAYERQGVNAIPEAFADELARRLNWPADAGVVQANIVSHTGADGFSRLARLAKFEGEIVPGGEQVTLNELRSKHGTELENWWKERFGHAFDALTQSEARYLARSPDADTIRNRIVAAE